MTDYADLDTLVGQLKRSAIDAYMRDQEFSITDSEYVRKYKYAQGVPFGASQPETKVSRPGENGEGGGTYRGDSLPEDTYRRSFNDIRERIDKAINPWRNLPDPKGIEAEKEKCRELSKRLNIAPIDSGSYGKYLEPSMEIDGRFNTLLNKSKELGGAAAKEFQDSFYDLQKSINAMCKVSMVLGTALGAEEGLFTETRARVVEVVTTARDALDEIAEKPSGGGPGLLKFAKWTVDAIGLFLGIPSGGAAVGLDAAAQGLGIIEELSGEGFENEEKSNSSYDAIKNFEETLKKLDKLLLKKGENDVNEKLRVCLNRISETPEKENKNHPYDIEVKPIREENIMTQGLNFDELVKTDLVNGLKTVQEFLDGVADNQELTACFGFQSVVRRADGLGVSVAGPNENFISLCWALHSLLKELAEDAGNMADNLEFAWQSLREVDESTSDKLNGIVSKIENDNNNDPLSWLDSRRRSWRDQGKVIDEHRRML